jgi:hypothetical protein
MAKYICEVISGDTFTTKGVTFKIIGTEEKNDGSWWCSVKNISNGKIKEMGYSELVSYLESI